MEHDKTIWFCRDKLALALLFWNDMIALLVRSKYYSFYVKWYTIALNHSCLNIHAMIRHMIKIMLGSIPHQKLSFYHLPTRGRAGIKLEDADTSPSYLYFLIVSCQYYTSFTYFWQLFILFIWTNLLIQCPVPVPVCCMFLFHKKSISNEVQMQ